MNANTHTVRCSDCDTERPSELASTPGEKPPCDCGSTNITIMVAFEPATLGVGGRVGPTLGVDHDRDWQRRWDELQSAPVLNPRSGGLSAETIHAGRDELEDFYGDCFHLRDYLANDPGNPLTAKQIRSACDADPTLALVADLANTGKHGVLTKTLHSGYPPKIVSERGASRDVGSGWLLKVDIEHGSNTFDGVTVANDAVSALKAQLEAWGLI